MPPGARPSSSKCEVSLMALFTAIKREIVTNHDRFKNVAAGLQSYAIVLGVLIGAAWALYTFFSLGARDKALAELNRLDFELRKDEVERLNREQVIINIEVKAEQVSIPNDRGRSIRINIQAKNSGSRNLILKLPEYAITVAKVRPEQDGRLMQEWVQHPPIPYLNASRLADSDGHVKSATSELLRFGQTVSYPSWLRVEEAGLYFIEFEAELTGEELKVAQQAVGDEDHPFHAVGQTFIVVR